MKTLEEVGQRFAGVRNAALAAVLLLLISGFIAYRLFSSQKPQDTHQTLVQKHTELVKQLTARIIRDSIPIQKKNVSNAEKTRELNASFYKAQADFYKVEQSGYTMSYPSSSY